MKRFLILTLCTLSAAAVSAQGVKITRTGVWEENGKIVFGEPHSIIAVDLCVEETELAVGPYARYAQKYLGVRAPLNDRTTYRIVGASLSLLDDDAALTTSYAESLPCSQCEFPRLLPDRLEQKELDTDAAASAAAEMIFSLRRSRMELVMGEIGENVFGAGLKSALKTIDEYEKEYLELFFGKSVVTTKTVRLVVRPAANNKGYVLGRFSDKSGVIPSTDLSGEILMLQIEPSGNTSLTYIAESEVKEKGSIECRIADPSTCTLSCGTEHIISAVLPLYEFGRTVIVKK